MLMDKDLANYLKSKLGLNRLMISLRDKYISLNRYSGSIVINNINKEEAIDISDLLGKTYKVGMSVRTSFKEISRKINETKFKGFEWEGLFKYYFKDSVISKSDRKLLDSSSYFSFLNDILDRNSNNRFIFKFKSIVNSDCILYSYLKKLYNKDKNKLKVDLDNIFLLLDNLPLEPTNLALYASLTGNPHYLDLGTNTFNMFLRFLCFVNDEDIPVNNDERIEILSKYNIYVDYFSNFVITYNLVGCQILDIFKNNKQIFNINLSNVIGMDNIDTDKKLVFIFENPSILNVLKDMDISVIITSGMPNMTLYKILDKLVSNNNQLYYNGDFDPEGLIIADKLKKRYKDLELFCYDRLDYETCMSNEVINDSRISKLEGVKSRELRAINELLKSKRYSGYQEKNIENIKKFILDRC